jgi:hypothetical protein
MTTKDDSLTEIGNNAFSEIRDMVFALNCDYERLAELREERETWVANDGGDEDEQDRTPEAWASEFTDEAQELADLEDEAGECESQDDARERIQEDPLSLEFRSDWVSSKDEMDIAEYCLLLTTGGPAVRIIGDIEDGEATSARLEVQDWGTPWTEHILTGDDHETLMAYVREFYFGA